MTNNMAFFMYNLLEVRCYMKKVIIISLILGTIFSLFMFFNYKSNSNKEKRVTNTEIYFLQIGAYKNHENVTNITKTLPYYLVIEEEKLYHVYVGITKSEENAKKIKEFYTKSGNNIYIRAKTLSNENFIKSTFSLIEAMKLCLSNTSLIFKVAPPSV